MLWVTKASGTKEKFNRKKIINTCLRLGADEETSRKVALEVRRSSYPGIPTSEILQLIFKSLGKYKPEIKAMIDLRKALSRLRPKPDFEEFVRLLLREYSYEVLPPQILRGECIEHEIDGIARKGKEILLVEVKHHYATHTPTPLEVSLSVWATLQDLKAGFRLGLHKINFTNALIVCNTKLSTHARNYATCKGMKILSWNFPPERSLSELIRAKKLYPITMLKSVDKGLQESLGDIGIVLLKQLAEADPRILAKQAKVRKEKILLLVNKAKRFLNGF